MRVLLWLCRRRHHRRIMHAPSNTWHNRQINATSTNDGCSSCTYTTSARISFTFTVSCAGAVATIDSAPVAIAYFPRTDTEPVASGSKAHAFVSSPSTATVLFATATVLLATATVLLATATVLLATATVLLATAILLATAATAAATIPCSSGSTSSGIATAACANLSGRGFRLGGAPECTLRFRRDCTRSPPGWRTNPSVGRSRGLSAHVLALRRSVA